MRRTAYPYNSWRFLLDTATGEVHDLDRERKECGIDEIEQEHVLMSSTTLDIVLRRKMLKMRYRLESISACPHCAPDMLSS